MRLYGIVGTTFLALAGLLPAASAGAAPQLLGVVAGNGTATPLTCDGADCAAEVSAFCLQQARAMPDRGTAYRPAAPGGIALLATTAAGEILRLPGADHLTFTSSRGFAALRVSLPRATMERLGAVAVAVEIGPAVSMLPVPVAGDPDPQSAEEIALATGPMRAVAAHVFDQHGPTADAARATEALINALPERGRSAADMSEALWRKVVAEQDQAAAPEGLTLAARLHGQCVAEVTAGQAFSLRRCLEAKHDNLMVDSNLRFWAAVGGS